LQAFLGIRQVEKAGWAARRRNENHVLYGSILEGVVEFQQWADNVPVSISFGALARDSEHRREIVSRLVENGVETRIFSAGNLGLHPFWTDLYGRFDDEMSNKIHACGFFLPNYPELTVDEINHICNIVKNDI
jgi:CDP-6-deoxy-D-xylo-4-hexulose-3-dehydrase